MNFRFHWVALIPKLDARGAPILPYRYTYTQQYECMHRLTTRLALLNAWLSDFPFQSHLPKPDESFEESKPSPPIFNENQFHSSTTHSWFFFLSKGRKCDDKSHSDFL